MRRPSEEDAGHPLLAYLTDLYRTAPKKRWVVQAAAPFLLRPAERTVMSPDGTSLAVRICGDGVPLVLVHGTLSGRDNAFALVEPVFAEEFQVWTYDRRGRGRSGDVAQHSLDKEVEDLFAVLDAVGSPAHVVAHSFGAVCALLGAQRGASMRSLVLYEPPLRQTARNEVAVRTVDHLVAHGDLDGALQAFYREVAGVGDDEVALLRSMPPVWKQLQDGVRTAPRELAALRGFTWMADDWSLPHLRMLLVRGAETRDPVFPSVDELRQAFPHADADVIPGQRHLAMAFAPWRLADGVVRFLRHG